MKVSRIISAVIFAAILLSASVFAEPLERLSTALEASRATMVTRGVAFLRENQTPGGAWSPQMGIGPTAVVVKGLIDAGVVPNDPTLAKSLEFLSASVQPDGGIYTPGGSYQNYETCLAMMGFAAARDRGESRFAELLRNAEAFVRNGQFTDENGNLAEHDESFRGGAGYGEHKRPDLSNTHFFVEALRATGTAADDPALAKALTFVSRCQNLESEHNTLPFAAKNPDGGFIYSCADGTSKAGETDDGGLRSYASMTYAGLKSMIYAGLTPTDRRVQAAHTWITKHYDVASNPGMGQQGLFYYYQVMAKALTAMGMSEVTAADGAKHDWRRDLIETLAAKQQADGSWLNPEPRWLENDPHLVTGYVLMALAACQ